MPNHPHSNYPSADFTSSYLEIMEWGQFLGNSQGEPWKIPEELLASSNGCSSANPSIENCQYFSPHTPPDSYSSASSPETAIYWSDTCEPMDQEVECALQAPLADHARQFLQETAIQASSHNSDSNNGSYKNDFPLSLIVEQQPPVEIRTRTPLENRTFTVLARIKGDFAGLGVEALQVQLLYAKDGTAPKEDILGGTLTVPLSHMGVALFDTLSIREASTKHGEREFCLDFTYVLSTGIKIPSGIRSEAFYSYSHKKVLNRRKNLQLVQMGKDECGLQGGLRTHVVGTPFINSPALGLMVRTPHGNVHLSLCDGGLERFSDTVLFFQVPPYPFQEVAKLIPEGGKIACQVLVTNDGRNYSNAMDLVYIRQA